MERQCSEGRVSSFSFKSLVIDQKSFGTDILWITVYSFIVSRAIKLIFLTPCFCCWFFSIQNKRFTKPKKTNTTPNIFLPAIKNLISEIP